MLHDARRSQPCCWIHLDVVVYGCVKAKNILGVVYIVLLLMHIAARGKRMRPCCPRRTLYGAQ